MGGDTKTGRGEDQSDEEYILGHAASVAEERVAVQAEVIMAYLPIL